MNQYLYLTEQYFKDTVYPLSQHQNDNSAFVYVIINKLSGLSKIGITNSPMSRKSQLQSQSGMELFPLLLLELEIDYDESAGYIEAYLHKFYKKKRSIGEWFNLNVKDIIQIRNLFYFIEGCDMEDRTKEYLEYLKTGKQRRLTGGISIINSIIKDK